VIVGLITLAFVGVLQSLGALAADTVPVEPQWRSDAAGEDERGRAAPGEAPGPDAAGVAAVDLPYRAEPSLDAVARTTAPASSVRFRSPDSRAPPALLAPTSV
jgi:hypothetical protein